MKFHCFRGEGFLSNCSRTDVSPNGRMPDNDRSHCLMGKKRSREWLVNMDPW